MHFIKLLVQGKALISHNFHCLSVAIKMTTSLHTCVISHEHLNWQEVTLSCEKLVVSPDEQNFRLANDTSCESETGTDTCIRIKKITTIQSNNKMFSLGSKHMNVPIIAEKKYNQFTWVVYFYCNARYL